MNGLFALLLGLGALGTVITAACVAFRLGCTMVMDVLANREPLPGWFEAVTPLKGRWLRLLLAAPGITVFVVCVFVIVLYAGAILGSILMGALWCVATLFHHG
jgi:hypothetical protein